MPLNNYEWDIYKWQTNRVYDINRWSGQTKNQMSIKKNPLIILR